MKQETLPEGGWQEQIHLPGLPHWYVADLPGHNGTTRVKMGPGRNSDWGWTTDPSDAIPLSPYWMRRFKAYCKRAVQRRYHRWGTMVLGVKP